MPDAVFEWDDAKSAANYAKHGVGFDHAIQAFRDPFAVERIDDRADYGEERINVIGMWSGVILHVTDVERGATIRINLACRATKHEQEDDARENAS